MKNTALRNALILSVALHLLAITPLYGFVMFREAVDTKKPIVVDYLVAKDLPRIDARKARPRSMAQETKKTDTSRDVAMKTTPGSSRITQKAEARIRGTKDYISYYELIREKIRSCLKAHYNTRQNEGRVQLSFTLKADGSLVSVEADEPNSTDNETLLDIAVRSVREAAPFAPFPKAISLPRMSFDLLVTFKKQ
jgi:TonB family protein